MLEEDNENLRKDRVSELVVVRKEHKDELDAMHKQMTAMVPRAEFETKLKEVATRAHAVAKEKDVLLKEKDKIISEVRWRRVRA